MQFVQSGLALVLALTLATPSLAGGKRITSEQDFRNAVVGHRFNNEQGWILIQADGTLKGVYSEKKMIGAWNWQKGFFCRNIRLGGKDIPGDCQKVQLDGKTMTLTRKQGRGKAVSLQRK